MPKLTYFQLKCLILKCLLFNSIHSAVPLGLFPSLFFTDFHRNRGSGGVCGSSSYSVRVCLIKGTGVQVVNWKRALKDYQPKYLITNQNKKQSWICKIKFQYAIQQCFVELHYIIRALGVCFFQSSKDIF